LIGGAVAKRVGNVLEDAMLLKSPDGQDANTLPKLVSWLACLSSFAHNVTADIPQVLDLRNKT